MATSKSLFGLPNELLAMIIGSDDLTVKDLKNLRRTCKHTKHFASSTLGRRIFANLDINYDREAFDWFTNLLLSDLGNHIQSVCLTWWSLCYRKCFPLKQYRHVEVETEPKFCQLRDVTIECWNGPAHLWKKALCASAHLKTFDSRDRDLGLIGS